MDLRLSKRKARRLAVLGAMTALSTGRILPELVINAIVFSSRQEQLAAGNRPSTSFLVRPASALGLKMHLKCACCIFGGHSLRKCSRFTEKSRRSKKQADRSGDTPSVFRPVLSCLSPRSSGDAQPVEYDSRHVVRKTGAFFLQHDWPDAPTR